MYKLLFAAVGVSVFLLTTRHASGVVASASSGVGEYAADRAVDRRRDTRWSSDFSDPQWLQLDWGKPKDLVGVKVWWETAFAAAYEIWVSNDGQSWSNVFRTSSGDGGLDDVDFPRTEARFLKVVGTRRGTAWGYSIFEITPKTTAEPWGEGEPSGYFLRTPTPVSPDAQGFFHVTNGWFVPAAWSNASPFVQSTDLDGEVIVCANGICRTNAAINRKMRMPVKDMLRFDEWNTFRFRVHGCLPRTLLLAGGDAELQQGLRMLRQADHKEYFRQLARMEPEGFFPYWLTERQGFWTVVGTDNDDKESLFCQDGTIEPYKCFSVAPFLFIGNRLITRADADVDTFLEDGYLPMPVVRWRHANLEVRIRPFASGPPNASTTYVRYEIHNAGTQAVQGKLYLAIRPFEVNPPWQWGGFTRIHDVQLLSNHLAVNEYRLVPLTSPTAFGAASAEDGDITAFLAKGDLPRATSVRDENGLASAALEYSLALAGGAQTNILLAIPLHADSPVAKAGEIGRLASETASYWSSRVHRVRFMLPDREWEDTLYASLAYLLINRDPPAIQPGSRAYEAAWMRDGAISSEALLRMGYTNEVRDFLAWYSNYLYEDGRVPAIVIKSRNEVNPVHEYDSQGQFVHACVQYYLFTRDRMFLAKMWPRVSKALSYLRQLRLSNTSGTPPTSAEQRRYFGILPRSVSHEGYYPEPGNHSYWDNYWALRGWRDGITIARILGRTNDIAALRSEEAALRSALLASLEAAMEHCRIDYLPGCAELCDFDPSATAVAATSCDIVRFLPVRAWRNTLDRYWQNLQSRQAANWTGSFSPYEFRIAHAYVLGGQRERAVDLVRFLMAYRRPAGWRQWPEAVYMPADTPGYIGDMPHTWVAAGFLGAVRACLLYEDEGANVLVLAAGAPADWLSNGKSVGIYDAPTYWGKLTYRMDSLAEQLHVQVTGEATPPRGFCLRLPASRPVRKILLNGVAAQFSGGNVRFRELPADITVHWQPSANEIPGREE